MFEPPNFQDPQIEVAVSAARKDYVYSQVRAAGLRPVPISHAGEADTITPVLVDLQSAQFDPGAMAGLRTYVLVGEVERSVRRLGNVITAADFASLGNVPQRLLLRRRAFLRTNEIELRAETARAFGNPLYGDRSSEGAASVRLLYIGGISPDYIPLHKACLDRNVDVTASLSTAMAAIHLEKGAFRIVLVAQDAFDADRTTIEALHAAHSNATFLLASDSDTTGALDGSVNLGEHFHDALDLIAVRAHAAPMSTRLSRVRLTADSHDPHTGVYSEAFFRAHLPRQLSACHPGEMPLTLLHLRFETVHQAREHPGILTLADAVVRRLHETDLVARIGSSSLLVSLRDSPYAGAARLAQRLSSQLAELGGDDEISWRAVERRSHHTAPDLIDAALSGPFQRSVAA